MKSNIINAINIISATPKNISKIKSIVLGDVTALINDPNAAHSFIASKDVLHYFNEALKDKDIIKMIQKTAIDEYKRECEYYNHKP